MLVKSNARKDRMQLVIFFLILCLASFLLCFTLLVKDYGSIYDKRARERGIPDLTIYGRLDKEKAAAELNDLPQMERWEAHEVIVPGKMTVGTSNCKKVTQKDDMILFSRGDEGYKATLEFLKNDESVKENGIYLNVYFARKLGVTTGDGVTFSHEELGNWSFTVAGIYEDLLMGNGFSYCSALLGEDDFGKMKEKCEALFEEKGLNFTANFIRIFLGEEVPKGTWERLAVEIAVEGGDCEWGRRADYRAGYVAFVNILTAFTATLAVIILAITIMTIAFVIKNNLEKEIKNIGALRAVGNTTLQIRLPVTLEYGMISALSAMIGIALSYAVYPFMEAAYLQELTGLTWERKFHPSHALALLGGSLLLVLGISFFATRRVRRLSPAMAMRFGLEANSFRRNYFPLADSRGNLHLLMALKACMQNGAQNLMTYVAMTAVAFVGMFAAVLFYNTQIDVSEFQHLIQGDVPDAFVYFEEPVSPKTSELWDARKELLAVPGVRQAYGLGSTVGHVGERTVSILYSDACENVYCGIYEGVMALEDNEAVIAGALAQELGIGVGDEIEVSFGDAKAKYLVTGLQQAVYGMGVRVYLTDGGAERLGISTVHDHYRIRVDKPDAEKVDEVLRRVKEGLGDRVGNVENYYRFQRSMDNVPVLAVTVIVSFLAALSVIIVALVMTLLLQNIFVRREKEFGIKKAVGFTSGQLRLQLSLSLSVILLAAAVSGALMGYFLINPLVTWIFWSYGIKKARLLVCWSAGLVTILGMVILGGGISFLLARRMKKLSAYDLIQE